MAAAWEAENTPGLFSEIWTLFNSRRIRSATGPSAPLPPC